MITNEDYRRSGVLGNDGVKKQQTQLWVDRNIGRCLRDSRLEPRP